MEMNKKVMVFMPCYNCEKYVAQAIESVLQQSYRQFELIILDDGSTDRSFKIIEKYAAQDRRIRIYRNEKNQGIVFTRNRGLDLCECDYLGLMDADDITVPKRLEREIAFLEEHPDITVVGGRYQQMNESGELSEHRSELVQSDSAIRAHMLFHNVIANGTVLMRKKWIDDKGIRYKIQYKSGEDYRFWCEVLREGRMYNMDQVFQYYRVHEASLEHVSNNQHQESRYENMMETQREILFMQGYVLQERKLNLLLEVLSGKRRKLNLWERGVYGKILDYLANQGENRDAIYRQELEKCIRDYRCYAESRLQRRLKRICSMRERL